MYNRPLTSWLDVTASVRVDHLRFNRDDSVVPFSLSEDEDFEGADRTEFGYNLAALFKPTARDRIRLIHSRGTSTPALLELGSYGILLPVPGAPPGTPDLILEGRPEAVTSDTFHFELGYERQVDAINGSGRVSLFYQMNDDLREFSSVPVEGRSLTTISNGDADVFGVELEADGRFDAPALDGFATWDVGYTALFVDSQLDLGFEDGAVNEVNRLTPTHTFNALLGFTRGSLELDGFFEFVSDFEIDRTTGQTTAIQEIDDYVVIGGRLGYHINDQVEIAVSADQINEASLVRGPGRAIDRRFFGTLAVTF
jgi:outer membrane receptor protein involved in Fe transport